MGAFADAFQERLRERFAERLPALSWSTERGVAGTPVDVAGEGDGRLVLLELEWRRADPADNAAKLFRHVESGSLDAFDRIHVVQAFTRYYDLETGGVSAKRNNAEFVGGVADRALDRVTYDAVDVPIDPPKRGGDRPVDWERAAATTVDRTLDCL